MGNTDFHAPFVGLGFGATNVKIGIGNGDPNVSDNATGDLAACSLGSLFIRRDSSDSTHFLYVKTGPNTQSNPSGVWTNK